VLRALTGGRSIRIVATPLSSTETVTKSLMRGKPTQRHEAGRVVAGARERGRS